MKKKVLAINNTVGTFYHVPFISDFRARSALSRHILNFFFFLFAYFHVTYFKLLSPANPFSSSFPLVVPFSCCSSLSHLISLLIGEDWRGSRGVGGGCCNRSTPTSSFSSYFPPLRSCILCFYDPASFLISLLIKGRLLR